MGLRKADGQAAFARFLVLAGHVVAGALHDLDNAVEGDEVRAAGVEREHGGAPGLGDAHGVALDARRLHEALERIAGQPQVVLDGDLRGVVDLPDVAAQKLAQRRRGHGGRAPDLALTADLRAGQRRVRLDDHGDGPGRRQRAVNLLPAEVEAFRDLHQDARHDTRRAVGRRRDDAAAVGVFLVDRIRVGLRARDGGIGGLDLAVLDAPHQVAGAPLQAESARKLPVALEAAVDAGAERGPDALQPVVQFAGPARPRGLVSHHEIAHAAPRRLGRLDQARRVVKRIRRGRGNRSLEVARLLVGATDEPSK